MSTLTAAHRKLIDEIRVGDRPMRFDITDRQAAQLICDSEARAVEAALHGANVDGITLCGCKEHTHRKDLSCCKIRRADGTPLTVVETFAALTAERERVRVLEEALAFITKHGGMTFETECGEVQCSGFWCAEQARAALATPERKEGA